jgi:intraflagellar transport protein 80
LICRRLEWRSYEATLTGRKTIALRNVQNETWEKLELNDRIIQVSLAHDHLVVVTTSQCFVYSTKNWNTPVILSLREGNVRLIVQAEKCVPNEPDVANLQNEPWFPHRL